MPNVAELLKEAERRPLLGWDLSREGRITYAPPWDFEALVDPLMAASPDLLDMGTGGGEWLSRRPFPRGRTVATEGWLPNVPVARARLAPLRIGVVAVVGAPDNADQSGLTSLPALPFAGGAFHLIVNRHESFVASEVFRLLAPGGRFVTQQVGSGAGEPFRAMLGAPSPPAAASWNLGDAIRQVRASGLELAETGEGAALIRFADVGALAWYLVHVPWVMPEFSIARHRRALEELHERGIPGLSQPLFWLAATRPAGATHQ